MAGGVAPLCCLKKLDALRFTSTLSIGFVVFVTCIVFAYAVSPDLKIDPEDVGPTQMVIGNDDTFKILTIFIFGYTCHQNIFSICNELKDLNKPRINTVIVSSISSALFVYLVIAISGYATFGSKVSGDALEMYPTTPLLTVTRVFVAILVVCSFPLQCFPCRHSTEQIVTSILGAPESDMIKQRRWWIITACICILAWFISMVVTSLGLVLSVVGATGSTTISYILPGFVYYSLQREWSILRVLAFAQFVLGCIIIPSALTFIFLYQ
mmetsp:Transcript_10580/g.16926  ORF Transcript_10580/g.16926 Transcript_10580/m.16926 type:complete len:268 (+) Transcript_10580:776-1579(+)